MVDDRSQVELAFLDGKDNPIGLGLFPLTDHNSCPVCERDNSSADLALLLHSQKPKWRSVDSRNRNICPFLKQLLTDAVS
jgi:hypothetical protein